LEGFPASATDEEQILQFVRQAFGSLDQGRLGEKGGWEMEFSDVSYGWF